MAAVAPCLSGCFQVMRSVCGEKGSGAAASDHTAVPLEGPKTPMGQIRPWRPLKKVWCVFIILGGKDA